MEIKWLNKYLRQLGKAGNQFFRMDMRKHFNILFNLIASLVIVCIGVDILYRIVRSDHSPGEKREVFIKQVADAKKEKKFPLSYYQTIIDRNLFGSLTNASKNTQQNFDNLEPTSLKVALLGTVTDSQQKAYAVIEEIAQRKQGLYKVGDSVQNAVVKMILRGKVVLRVGDKDEILTMEESSSKRREKETRPKRIKRRPRSRVIKRPKLPL